MRSSTAFVATFCYWIGRTICFRHISIVQTFPQRKISEIGRVIGSSVLPLSDSIDQGVVSSGAFVESFELQNWGLFEQSTLNLGSTPLFAVITGETGSGKSVLISALHYLYSSSGTPQSRKNAKGKNDFFISNSKSISNCKSKSVVTLRKGNEKYSKSYDAENRKTMCELNGKKITIKNVVGNLKNDVRFWSAESLFLLESGSDGFINYVDKNLCDDGNMVLTELADVFSQWVGSYNDFTALRELKRRKDDDDEADLFSHFVEEISTFEAKLQKILTETFHILNEISDSLFEDTGIDEPTSTLTPSPSPSFSSSVAVSAIEGLLVCIEACSPDLTQHIRHSASAANKNKAQSPELSAEEHSVRLWKAFTDSLHFLSEFCRAVSESPFAATDTHSHAHSVSSNLGHNNNNNNNKVKHRVVKGRSDAVDLSFDTISRAIEEYENKILNLQSEFLGLNLLKTSIDARLEILHVCLQNIESNIKKAKKEVFEIQNSLPMSKVNELLDKLEMTKSECDKLCRKHEVSTYKDLQKKSEQWQKDKSLMENLIYTLPESEKRELELREEYTEMAIKLTELRIVAASRFIERINALLPQLEMPDKLVGVKFRLNAGGNRAEGCAVLGKGSRGGDGGGGLCAGLEDAFSQWRDRLLDTGGISGNFDHSSSRASSERNVSCDSSSFSAHTEEGEGKGKASNKALMKMLSQYLVPRGEVTAKGWDDVSLSVRPYGEMNTFATPSPPTSFIPLSPVSGFDSEVGVGIRGGVGGRGLSMRSTVEMFLGDLCGEEDGGDWDGDWEGPLDVGVLSSGESTRLALALETCTYSGTASTVQPTHTAPLSLSISGVAPGISDPRSASKDKGKVSESLLILDEIDAHIGGEAAIAVAKLLKEQGKWRQVVLITHNPLVASLADRHFVVARRTEERADSTEKHGIIANESSLVDGFADDTVSRSKDQNDSVGMDGSREGARDGLPPPLRRWGPAKSSLVEVTGSSREREIARMATGGGEHTQAGMALARALLATKS